MVVFAGMEFIFRFLPIFLILFYVTPKRFREIVLLLGSIVFYAFGTIRFLPVLLAATGLNYWLGRRRKKAFLITAVIIDLLLLTLFKVLSVTVDSELLPLGISFYLFKMIAYQGDIMKGRIQEKVSFKQAALYFCMFPQILSGPIMRYDEGEFDYPREYRLEKLEDGFRYFILGFGMKILLADQLAIFWNDMQMIGFASISTPLAWLGMFAYSLRLYFDFWGYSLMAAGLGKMLGFPFIRNFNHPYAARSVSDFYRRWHITLGSWFRDYVYIPLGGSRTGKAKQILNLLTVWVLTGIWHGSGINFLIWGALLGILIVVEKLWTGKFMERVPWLGNLYVLFVIPLSWIVFAIGDLKELGTYISRLFPFCGRTASFINEKDFISYLQNYGGLLAVGAVLCIPWVFDYYEKHKRSVVVRLALVGGFWISVYFVISQEGNPFMYLRF